MGKPLCFFQPLPCLGCIGMIEVTDLRFCKRLAKDRHAVLPLLFSDHRESFNVGEVFDAELEVLPGRTGVPAVETGHVEQHAQLPVLPNKPFNLWHKVFVIRFYQLAADVNDEYISAIFFFKLNGYFGLL